MKTRHAILLAVCALIAGLLPPALADEGPRFKKSRIVRKAHRPHHAKAITGPILQTSRPGTSEGYRVYGDATRYNDGDTQKELRKAQQRQEKAARRAARLAQRNEAQRIRQDRRALGNQVVAHNYSKRRRYR